jgi:hypothetical protein
MANMGMPQDMKQRMTLARTDGVRRRNLIKNAREIIYAKNFAVDTKVVKRLLFDESLVPTMVCGLYLCRTGADILSCQNASSDKLQPLGFNVFSTMVVDLLHEVELGVWKELFKHLLRILDCCNESLKHELDRRQALIGLLGN